MAGVLVALYLHQKTNPNLIIKNLKNPYLEKNTLTIMLKRYSKILIIKLIIKNLMRMINSTVLYVINY